MDRMHWARWGGWLGARELAQAGGLVIHLACALSHDPAAHPSWLQSRQARPDCGSSTGQRVRAVCCASQRPGLALFCTHLEPVDETRIAHCWSSCRLVSQGSGQPNALPSEQRYPRRCICSHHLGHVVLPPAFSCPRPSGQRLRRPHARSEQRRRPTRQASQPWPDSIP